MEVYKYTPNNDARRMFNKISKDIKSFVISTPELAVTAAIGDEMFEKHVKSAMPKKIGEKPKEIYNNCDSGYKHYDGICIGTIQKLNV